MKYRVKIVKLGELCKDFIVEKMVVLFDEEVPEELQEISVVHTKGELKEEVEKGDKIRIGEKEYIVTAVGDEANKTLKELGHCTLKFNGGNEADLPGVINLDGELGDIKVGDDLIIY